MWDSFKELLERGPDPKAQDEGGRTPMVFALLRRDLFIALVLLQYDPVTHNDGYSRKYRRYYIIVLLNGARVLQCRPEGKRKT